MMALFSNTCMIYMMFGMKSKEVASDLVRYSIQGLTKMGMALDNMPILAIKIHLRPIF